MNIFNEIETRLGDLGLGTNQFTRIAGKNIPRLVIRLIITLSAILLCLSEVALYILKDNNLSDRLMLIGVIVAYFPVTLIYVSLVSNTNHINNLFSYLENAIHTSNAQLIKN